MIGQRENPTTGRAPLGVLLACLFAGLAAGSVDGQASVGREGPSHSSAWWEDLGDPDLIRLLKAAAVANGDLDAAVGRILEAEATTVRARSALLPTLALDGQANTGPLDGLGFQFGGIPRDGTGGQSPSLYYTGSVNARASYRLSSWGPEYRSVRASRLEALARRGDEDGVALDLFGEVASAYYDAVAAANQIEIISEQVDASRQLADVTQLRYERGEATALEVLQQRQQLATVQATLPPARAELRLARTRLEALLGRDPSAISVQVGAELPLVPAASGGEAVSGPDIASEPEERPDLRGARDRLAAAGARVSAARWSFLPTIDLSASAGSQFFRSVGTNTQSTWGVGLTFSLPVFDGLDRSGRVREASAGERAARSSYEQLQRNAAAEMVSAGIQREEQQAQLEALQRQLEASERAFQESRRRYLAGLATVLDVLVALNGMQQAELGVVQTRRSVLDSWIRYRQAVGGPWTRGLRQRLLEAS